MYFKHGSYHIHGIFLCIFGINELDNNPIFLRWVWPEAQTKKASNYITAREGLHRRLNKITCYVTHTDMTDC